MIRDRAAALASTSLFEQRFIRYFPGQMQIREFSPEAVTVETTYLAIESVVDEPPAIFSVGRTFDALRIIDGQHFFDRREVVYDHTAIRNSLIFPI